MVEGFAFLSNFIRMTSPVGKMRSRKAPAWTERVLRRFGVNPQGQNVYRVVWSESRTERTGGMWHDRLKAGEGNHLVAMGNMVVDSNPEIRAVPEYRRVCRYEDFAEPCWVIEKWLPCSYSREQWYEDQRLICQESGLHLLGPYEENMRGDWHFSYKVQQRGKFIPLTAGVLEYYARLCNAGSRNYTETQRKIAIEDRVAREKRDYDNRFDAIFDDSQLAGGTANLFSAVSGPKSKDRMKPEDVNFGSVEELPDWVPRTGGFKQI
jgi:hypothetical protein